MKEEFVAQIGDIELKVPKNLDDLRLVESIISRWLEALKQEQEKLLEYVEQREETTEDEKPSTPPTPTTPSTSSTPSPPETHPYSPSVTPEEKQQIIRDKLLAKKLLTFFDKNYEVGTIGMSTRMIYDNITDAEQLIDESLNFLREEGFLDYMEDVDKWIPIGPFTNKKFSVEHVINELCGTDPKPDTSGEQKEVVKQPTKQTHKKGLITRRIREFIRNTKTSTINSTILRTHMDVEYKPLMNAIKSMHKNGELERIGHGIYKVLTLNE